MKLGLRGIMDQDGDIHVWPTLAMDHRDFFAAVPYFDDGYRVRFRQWNHEPGSKIDFDRGATREDMLRVCEFVLRMQQPALADDPSNVLRFARECGVR